MEDVFLVYYTAITNEFLPFLVSEYYFHGAECTTLVKNGSEYETYAYWDRRIPNAYWIRTFESFDDVLTYLDGKGAKIHLNYRYSQDYIGPEVYYFKNIVHFRDYVSTIQY